MGASPDLSLVVPVYNEALRLDGGLAQIKAFIAAAPFTCELVVVDDGSRDDTVARAHALLRDASWARVIEEPHRGKGGAVRSGMLAARGDCVIFLDVDLATPLEFVAPCRQRLIDGADVVIGSRRVEHAAIERPQSAVREWLGRGFSWLARTMTGVPTPDFTCGFKGFRKDAAHAVFSRQRLVNWSFDAEILFIAHRLRLTIAPLPVRWRDDRGTKVRLWRDVVGSLVGLCQIRIAHALGRYRLTSAVPRP